MSRPSCCKPRSQVPGVAAVALIIGAGVAASKIRPEAHRIEHDAAQVLRIAAVTTGAIAAVAITAWILIVLVRWRLRCRQTEGQVNAKVARARADIAANLAGVLDDETGLARIYAMHGQQTPASPSPPCCVACGGAGEVLRSDGTGRFEARACPECQPARLAE
jgi:hypothetical protein